MRSFAELRALDQDIFSPLEDLILEGFASIQEAASASELSGIQAFDRCGRSVVLDPKKGTDFLGVSIDGALKRVQTLMDEECSRITNNEPHEDPRGQHEYWRLQAELPLANAYGWKVKDLPNFARLHQQWCDQVLGPDHASIPTTRISTQAENSVKRLLRGLITVCYGEDKAQSLDSDKTPLISEIQEDLERKAFEFDRKTLTKWLKNAPS